MSPQRQLPELRIALRPSRRLAWALAIAHAGAAAAVVASVPNAAAVAACCALLSASACWTIPRHALLMHDGSVVAIELHGEDDCFTRCRNGQWRRCRVRPSSYVTRWLIVLDLGVPDRQLGAHAVLLPDSMSVDSHRRLLTRLRWSKPASPAFGNQDDSL